MHASNATVAEATFTCPKCRAAFPWSAQHVGRLCRCKCGNVMKVPPQPREGAVATVASPPPPLPSRAAPAPTAAMPAMAPAAVGAAVASDNSIPSFLRMPSADPSADQLDAETEAELAATGKYGEDADARNRPDPRRDLYIPLSLLAIGIILTFIGFNVGGAIGMIVAAFATAVKLIVSLVLFVIGALLAARFAGVCLGELGPALLKLAAVSIFPAALADLVTTLLGGDMAVAMIGNTVGIVACWSLVSYLFRLDGANTMSLVIAIAVVKFVLGFVVMALLALVVVSAAPSFDDSDLGSDAESEMMIEDGDADSESGGDSAWDD